MQSLWILYSALAVFGVGVTVVDMFGLFEHAGGHDDSDNAGGHDASVDGHDGGDHDGVGDHDGSYHDTGPHDDAFTDDDASADGHDGTHDDAHDGSHEPTHELTQGSRGSYVGSADSGTRAVARTIGVLRMGVYFSLGAGPTGLFALATGQPVAASLAWSAGAGLFMAALTRALRSLLRRDLDSSIRRDEFLMETAVLELPLAPGTLAKATVRHYGVESTVYVKAADATLALPKGARVRIIDIDDDCLRIEPAD